MQNCVQTLNKAQQHVAARLDSLQVAFMWFCYAKVFTKKSTDKLRLSLTL